MAVIIATQNNTITTHIKTHPPQPQPSPYIQPWYIIAASSLDTFPCHNKLRAPPSRGTLRQADQVRAALSRADSPYPWRVCGGIIRSMTQTPESKAEPTTVTGQSGNDDRRYGAPSRLGQVTAWVVIVAGVVFVVSVIFFSGLFLGWSSGAHYGWHRGYCGGRDGSCSMVGPGMMGPGMMGPGGPMGPQQSPTPQTPTAPHP